ncbi:MAG: hypothetical protein WKF41_18340 [Gaiellaceae bacterium]
MRLRGMVAVLAFLLVVSSVEACKGDKACAPGSTQTCTCLTGQGAQTCSADGSKWEACTCSGSSSGSGAGQPATVVPISGNPSAPVRDRPGFDNSTAVQQLKAGTHVELGEKKVTPGKKTPDTWFQVRLTGSIKPLGWMHADVLLWAAPDATKVACTRCAAGDAFCTQHCDAQACVECSTQEDFDAAGKKGQRCCGGMKCVGGWNECSGGRVCCRIPDGSLCVDSGRCAKANLVTGGCDFIYGGTDCVFFCNSDADCTRRKIPRRCTLDSELHPTRKTCGAATTQPDGTIR